MGVKGPKNQSDFHKNYDLAIRGEKAGMTAQLRFLFFLFVFLVKTDKVALTTSQLFVIVFGRIFLQHHFIFVENVLSISDIH